MYDSAFTDNTAGMGGAVYHYAYCDHKFPADSEEQDPEQLEQELTEQFVVAGAHGAGFTLCATKRPHPRVLRTGTRSHALVKVGSA